MRRRLLSRSRASFRIAELGFLGVRVTSFMQTPFFWGEPASAGRRSVRRFPGRREDDDS